MALNFLPARGGMEFVVHDLADALHDLGHDVTVFAPRWKNLPPEQDHRYRLVRFGWSFRGAFKFGFNRWPLKREFGRIQKEAPFDVISSHSAYLATSYALSLKKKYGVPVVVTCHGHDIQRHPETGYGLRLDPKKDRVIRSNLHSSDLTVSISPSIDEDLGEVLAADKIVSIPNGVEVKAASSAEDNWLRERVGSESDLIVISVGRNVPKKSFDLGIEAFALAVRQMPSMRYVHIGRDGEILQEQANSLGVGDRFHALGEQPRALVLQAYREADMFFSPAAVESFGIVTYEAMAASLPSVVSDGPGNRDAVHDGKTGIVVPTGSVDLMAEALIDLAANEARRREYGSEAKEAVARFSWPRIADEYVEAFTRLTDPGATRIEDRQ